jgi:hypothetical protein
MNIERLARHLKEFTIDEIEIIAECDCKTELEQLLNRGKLVLENGVYKIVSEQKVDNYEIFLTQNQNTSLITIENAVDYFMKNYVQKYCKFETYRNYNSIFKFNIIPFLKGVLLNNVGNSEVKLLYEICRKRGLKPRRIKNTMALFNQLIKYFQNLGIIDRTCNFQVRRLTDKNKFSVNRIIFEE